MSVNVFPFVRLFRKLLFRFVFFVCVCSMARVPAFLFFSFGKPEQEDVGVASKKSSVRGRGAGGVGGIIFRVSVESIAAV